MITIQKTTNTKGLVYIGRSLPASKVQKIEPISPVNPDPKFQYYLNLYIKGGKGMTSLPDLKEARADQYIKMDTLAMEDRRIPLIDRLQRREIGIDKSIENLRLLSSDMTESSAMVASAIRMLETLRSKLESQVEKLANKETTDDAKRTLVIKCHNCGADNYFTRKEYWVADGTLCRNCKYPL